MRPLWPPPTTTTSHIRRGQLGDRRRQADAPERVVDRTARRHRSSCRAGPRRSARGWRRRDVDVGRGVLDRQRPLLALPPRRQEHAAVVLVQPVGVAVAGVVARRSRGSCGSGRARTRPRPWRRTRSRSRGGGGGRACGGRARRARSRSSSKWRYAAGRQDLEQHGLGRGHRERVAVERADLLVRAVGDRPPSPRRCRRSRRTARRRRAPWRGRRCRARRRSARWRRPARS